MSKVVIGKKPDLILTTPNDNTYKNITQSELLKQVKLLHEQLFKTNKYLMDVHRISIYNWEPTDTGNIVVELTENKSFFLDSILRLRGDWDPVNNRPTLTFNDPVRAGWIFRVAQSTTLTEALGHVWKSGDYAMYDSDGFLHNVTANMLENLFTPIIPIESDTIQIDPIEQTVEGIQLRAHVKIDPTPGNDITASARGIFSSAYEKAKNLFTVQYVAPASDNISGGIKIVFLESLPEVMYEGWLYLVPPTTIEYNETNENSV